MHLYSFRICPFCNKAKSALRYLRIPYSGIEVNPLTRKEIRGLVPGYNRVPIAQINDVAIGGSLEIIQKAMETLSPRRTEEGFSDHFFSESARKWHDWSDTKFAIYLYPSITRSFSESYKMMGYVHDLFPAYQAWPIRTLGAFGMSMAHSKIKKKYDIEDERACLWNATEEWEKHVGSSFGGGDRPDLGDISVYGCIKGLDFIPIYQEFLQRPVFSAWFDRMEESFE
eukprot:GEMP01076039.1.p1 GENE.GEMP01076039.1~~GEMP01076039.1.p1  ORF type:complete len:227 (+),score=4.29 GEMP01076039.1:24-704(+)